MKKTRNPLLKRIPRELLGDWRKYFIVSLFLILSIGFVSGMYVANSSMMQAADEGIIKYKLEDGHFELNKQADDSLLNAIASGKKGDIHSYFLEKAKAEFDKEFDDEFYKEFKKSFDDEAWDEAWDKSYQTAYDEAWDEVLQEVEDKYDDAVEKYGLDSDSSTIPVTLSENFFRNETEGSDNTVRIFTKTDDVNLACVMDGRLPENDNEIAIDRMHADNADIAIGDTLLIGGQDFEVVGLIAYVNYATLHEKNSDMIFDALKFDVGMVTDAGFDRLSSPIHYNYAWSYVTAPEDITAQKQLSDQFLKVLLTQTVIADCEIDEYVPRYANAAVNFAREDMGSDMAMGGVILYILIAIIAFIFAVTCSSTITREASAIGTLRALGYTKGELIIHYLSMSVIVTLCSAIVGNILGYTLFKNIVTSMYYNSYSLPTYQTVWNSTAFIRTTFIPVLLMLIINLIVIAHMMQLTPLQFLRHDFKKHHQQKALRLPKISFFRRFRLRIILQNLPNYLILFVGVFFVAVMLAMAVGLPATLKHYQANASEMMFANYQYILSSYENEEGDLITTASDKAEPFDLCTLIYKTDNVDEEISVYGAIPDSCYISLPRYNELKTDEVYISSSYAKKYGLSVKDTLTLDAKYEHKKYTFTIAGIYDKGLSLGVFMPMKHYIKIFDTKNNAITGFLSDTEITDIDERYIATVITQREITKMTDQLDHSMGNYMLYYQYLCILLSAALIYLITKIIIEKNETAISMIKILGFEDREIFRLYLLSTTIVVVLADTVSTIFGVVVMRELWKEMMAGMNGYFSFVFAPLDYLKIFLFIFAGYLIVLLFDFRRIRKIPLNEALKNIE